MGEARTAETPTDVNGSGPETGADGLQDATEVPSPAAPEDAEPPAYDYTDVALAFRREGGCPSWCIHPEKCQEDVWTRGSAWHEGHDRSVRTDEGRVIVRREAGQDVYGGSPSGPTSAALKILNRNTNENGDIGMTAGEMIELAAELLAVARELVA